MRLELGLAEGEGREQGRHRPLALAPPRVLLRVEALVGQLERVARVRRLVREHHGAERAPDVEPLASLGQRLARPVDQRLRLALADGGEQTELVPSEAVGGSVAREDGRELGAEPREQRVSRGVAEAVVVALEAVEVEEHEHRRRDGSPAAVVRGR